MKLHYHCSLSRCVQILSWAHRATVLTLVARTLAVSVTDRSTKTSHWRTRELGHHELDYLFCVPKIITIELKTAKTFTFYRFLIDGLTSSTDQAGFGRFRREGEIVVSQVLGGIRLFFRCHKWGLKGLKRSSRMDEFSTLGSCVVPAPRRFVGCARLSRWVPDVSAMRIYSCEVLLRARR